MRGLDHTSGYTLCTVERKEYLILGRQGRLPVASGVLDAQPCGATPGRLLRNGSGPRSAPSASEGKPPGRSRSDRRLCHSVARSPNAEVGPPRDRRSGAVSPKPKVDAKASSSSPVGRQRRRRPPATRGPPQPARPSYAHDRPYGLACPSRQPNGGVKVCTVASRRRYGASSSVICLDGRNCCHGTLSTPWSGRSPRGEPQRRPP